MTSNQFKAKIKFMLKDDGGIANVILNSCLHVMSSEYAKGRHMNAAEDDFILPKKVLCAVLTELAWQYEPNDKAGRKQVKDLKPLVSIRTGKKVN